MLSKIRGKFSIPPSRGEVCCRISLHMRNAIYRNGAVLFGRASVHIQAHNFSNSWIRAKRPPKLIDFECTAAAECISMDRYASQWHCACTSLYESAKLSNHSAACSPQRATRMHCLNRFIRLAGTRFRAHQCRAHRPGDEHPPAANAHTFHKRRPTVQIELTAR